MGRPETRYAMSGDVAVAYQIVRDGPFDVVWVPGAVSNVELNWQDERWAAFIGRISSFRPTFEERGAAELRGVPGEWRLYAVADAAA